MKKIILCIAIITFSITLFSQTLLETIKEHPVISYGGSDIIEYNDTSYLVGVAAVEVGTKSISALRRVGMIKSQKEVTTFINGAEITSSTEMKTGEEVTVVDGQKSIIVSDYYLEQIRENTQGFIKSMRPLGYWYEEDKSVFYYSIYQPLTK